MFSFTTLLLLVSAVLLICSILKRVSGRLGIPSLLAFILLGMIFGSDGIFKIHFENYEFSEQISTLALVFIIFYGGF
ncbi:cation:proton antiporter, partial [Blautia hydrogenotrophica]